MDNRLIIFLIAVLGILICTSPIMAAENDALFDYALFDLNIFGGQPDNITVTDLIIEKVNTEHTDSEGKTDKHNDFFLKFKAQHDGDSMGNYSVNIKCIDKNNKTIKDVDSYVDKTGNITIPLDTSTYVAGVNVTIKDSNGNVVFEKSTTKHKTTDNITKDEPVEKKTESSGQTYWGSSNSNKFHNPGCEWAQKISSKNKVVFHSRDEAISAGYQPCQVCSP